MFSHVETKKIHARDVTITKTGRYSMLPSCFFGKKYAWIKTTLSYVDNNERVEIIIPPVASEGQNRNRVLQVKINDREISNLSHEARALLNMENTFDIHDMSTLIHLAITGTEALANDETWRFCLPFFDMRTNEVLALYKTPESFKSKTIEELKQLDWKDLLKHGVGLILHQNQLYYFSKDGLIELKGDQMFCDVDREDIIKNEIENNISQFTHNPCYVACERFSALIAPYHIVLPSIDHRKIKQQLINNLSSSLSLKSVTAEDQRKKEFIIPIVQDGWPHHWEICVVTIDEDNQTSLTLVSSSWPKNMQEDWFQANINLYDKQLLTIINPILGKYQYPTITRKQIFFHLYKQFSMRGCGFAAAIQVQKILNGNLPNLGRPVDQFDDIQEQKHPWITPEEDAIQRVQLARHLNLKIHQEQSPELNQPKELFQTLEPNLSPLAQQIADRLANYIQKIKGQNIDNINAFDQEFSWLSKSRALNRKTNYFLAKQLLFCIRKGDNLTNIFDMKAIREQRESILKRYRIHKERCYANRGMNSQTLDKIIQDARTTLALPYENVNDHFYRTKFFKFWRSCFNLDVTSTQNLGFKLTAHPVARNGHV